MKISDLDRSNKLFIPYFPMGYPDLPTSIDVLEALAKNGADILEIGMSFSDPLADGPVIQHATQVALSNGVTIEKTLQAVATLRHRGVTIPLVLMGYYNPLLAFGLKRFVERIRAVDIAGLIIPDLPLEEADDLLAVLGDIPLIQMVAPTTPKDRIAELAKNAGLFIYLVSITGITGSGSSFALNLPDLIAEIRQHSDLPICIGFGIDSAQKASQTATLADGVIVGTHVIKAIGGSNDPVMVATTLAREFRVALKG